MRVSSHFTYLDSMGLIAVTGIDAEKFLQGQLTCDVLSMQTQALGAYCNRQGRVLATFYLIKQIDRYFLYLPRNNLAATLADFNRYAPLSKVELHDVSDQWISVGMVGYEAISAWNQGMLEHANDILQLTIGDSKQARYLYLAPRTYLPTIQRVLQTITPSEPKQWFLADIHAKIPNIHDKTRALFTPQDINYSLLGGVSFKKGCYIGQEIVARMHYLGKAKQSLYHVALKSKALIEEGQAITQQAKTIGYWVNVIQDDDASYQGLAILPKMLAEAGFLSCDMGELSVAL